MFCYIAKLNFDLIKFLIGVLFGTILVITVVFQFSHSDIGYDTGLYHLQKIQWLVEYGHVPGLANLDSRLGFYSIYFYVGALLTWLFNSPNASLYLNLIIIVLFIVWLIFHIVQSKTHKWLILYSISLLGILYYQELFKSIYQDIGTYVVGITSLLYLLERLDENKKLSSVWILFIIAILISIKFSMAFLGILIVFYIKPLKNEFNIRRHTWIISFVIVLIAIIIWHNYWISGWLIYPSPVIDLFNTDWKVPEYLVQNQKTVTGAFAKSPGDLAHFLKVSKMGIIEWLPLWWHHNENMHWFIYIYVISYIVVLYMLIRNFRAYSNHLFAISTTIILGLLGWFLIAPNLRFGLVWLNGVLILAIYLVFKNYKLQYWILRVKLLVLLFISLIFIKQMGLGSAITEGYPPLDFNLDVNIPQPELKCLVLNSDTSEIFYTPGSGEQPFYSEKLPVASRIHTDSLMPFINDVPRYRKQSIKQGFYTDPNLSVKKISSDSLNIYFSISREN